MKKIFLISTILLSFIFVSCFGMKFVTSMEESQKSWGTEIRMSRFDANSNLTTYTLMIPNSLTGETPTFFENYFEKGNIKNAKNVKKLENVSVGEKTYENGKLKSIVIDGKKYIKE